MKSRDEKSQRREEKKTYQKRESKKKEVAGARKGRKVAKHRETLCFPRFWEPGVSKSRLAKVAGAEPSGQMRDEKLHTVLARSARPRQNAQGAHAPVARSSCGRKMHKAPHAVSTLGS